MRKIIILIILFVVLSIFIRIPRYKELNNIKLIDRIDVYCNHYVLREILLDKEDNNYEYKYYKEKDINGNIYYIDKAKKTNKCIKKDST